MLLGLLGTVGVDKTVLLVGVRADGVLGQLGYYYWSVIDDDEIANWTVISDNTSDAWSEINNAETANWNEITTV